MLRTENDEEILEDKDLTNNVIEDICLKIFDAGTCRRKAFYYNDFMTMDIETTTIRSDIRDDFAFTYSIAVYIAEKCIKFTTWREYNKFIQDLANTMYLSKNTRLVCFVHNLPYEFQFMRDFTEIEEVFAVDKRKVVKFFANGIEYRCSYKLTNMSLERFTESTPVCVHKKQDGEDFDYTKIRYPWSELSPKELQYIYNDVAGLYESVDYMISTDKYNIAMMPLTSTGYVRRDLREAMGKNPRNRENFLSNRVTPHVYGLLRESRRGGNTHATPIWSNEELEDLDSEDMSSAYPAEMVQKPMPMTKFLPIKNLNEWRNYIENPKYAVLMDVSFSMISVKTLNTIPYIPTAKCTGISSDVRTDNGRVLEASSLSIVITDIDYKIIKDVYDFSEDSIEVRSCYVSKYGYLPDELRKEIIHQYFNKTTKKDGDEYYYMKIKNKFNANFGCMLTDICRETIEYVPHSEKPFTKTKPDYEIAINKYYKNHSNFLQYQHGVWITAWCRYRLQQAINGLGRDMVYCDTDSVKYLFPEKHKELFKRLNDEIKQDIKKCGLNCTVEYKGKTYTMGLWEKDAHYKKFKTMGAKKYCYVDDNDKFHITVAGLSKTKGAKYLEKIGGMEAFHAGTIIPISESGRTSATYNDYESIKIFKVDGKEIEVGSNIVITDTTYEFTLSEDYEHLLLAIQQGEFY